MEMGPLDKINETQLRHEVSGYCVDKKDIEWHARSTYLSQQNVRETRRKRVLVSEK